MLLCSPTVGLEDNQIASCPALGIGRKKREKQRGVFLMTPTRCHGDDESAKLLRHRRRFNIGHLAEIYVVRLPKPNESTTFRVHRFRIQSSTGRFFSRSRAAGNVSELPAASALSQLFRCLLHSYAPPDAPYTRFDHEIIVQRTERRHEGHREMGPSCGIFPIFGNQGYPRRLRLRSFRHRPLRAGPIFPSDPL